MLQVLSLVDGRPAVRGELCLFTVPVLEAALADLGSADEVDLSGVTFFDSSALRTFLAVRRRNARMRIVNPSEPVVRVLEMTGTLDYLVYGREINW